MGLPPVRYMVVWWSIGAGVHVEPHSHPNEQIVWLLKGEMELLLGNEQRVCGRGDFVVVPAGAEHEAWFREDSVVGRFLRPAARRHPLACGPHFTARRAARH